MSDAAADGAAAGAVGPRARGGGPPSPPPPPPAPEEPGWRAWARPFALAMALTLLVAAGTADQGPLLSVVVVVAGAVGFGALFRLFPGDADFAFGAASGFAVYACVYDVIARSAVPDAPAWATVPAFLAPMLALLGGCWACRARLRAAMRAEERGTGRGLGSGGHALRIGRWFGLMAIVAVASLSFPVNRLPPAGQGLALLGAMALVAGLVAAFVEDVVRFLVDIAGLIGDVTRRLEPLSVPVATFGSIFAVGVIAFACLYRIADGLSAEALFGSAGGPVRLSFPDALHFSLATIATVGYGDIYPIDDGVRLLSAAEVVAGQVLLLFGFYEIMNSRRVNQALDREDEGAKAAARGAAEGDASADDRGDDGERPRPDARAPHE